MSLDQLTFSRELLKHFWWNGIWPNMDRSSHFMFFGFPKSGFNPLVREYFNTIDPHLVKSHSINMLRRYSTERQLLVFRKVGSIPWSGNTLTRLIHIWSNPIPSICFDGTRPNVNCWFSEKWVQSLGPGIL